MSQYRNARVISSQLDSSYSSNPYSKGDNAACGSVVVSVVSGEAPTFVLRAEDTVVNPKEKTVVRAVVRGPAGTRVSWECVNEDGFDYFDLAKVRLKVLSFGLLIIVF